MPFSSAARNLPRWLPSALTAVSTSHLLLLAIFVALPLVGSMATRLAQYLHDRHLELATSCETVPGNRSPDAGTSLASRCVLDDAGIAIATCRHASISIDT